MEANRILLCIAIGLFILSGLLYGCSPSARLPCPEPGEVMAYPAPSEGLVALTLENNICMNICQVLVSPNHCEYMGGVNWVEDLPLRSGESITMYVEPGEYAVWLEICTERFRADEGIRIYTDTVHKIVDDPIFGSKPPCGTSITVVNNSEVSICRLWISNTESAYASWNWLGAEPIQPGEALELKLRPDDYKIRAEDCEGNILKTDIDRSISGPLTWTVP